MRKGRRSLVVGLVLLCTLSALSLLVPALSAFKHNQLDPKNALTWSWNHPLGADELGRDMLVRVAEGLKISLFIAILALLLECAIGITYGAIAGFYSRASFLVYPLQIISSIPSIFYSSILISLFGNEFFTVVLALSFARWSAMATIVRAEVMKLKEKNFVKASQLLGGGFVWILRRHIVPNMLRPIFIRISASASRVIFYEASLSFLGIGVKPPLASLGRLVFLGFRTVHIYPGLFFVPFAALFLLILSFELITYSFTERK